MTVARSKIVDPSVTPWYHCISRCVRGAHLLSGPGDQRKRWIQSRLEELAKIFAIDVAGFGVLDSHLHVLLHLNVKTVRQWTKTEVLQRWAKLHPPRGTDRKPLKNVKDWIKKKRSDHRYVNMIRDRLVNLGWFMKSLKEPLARRFNKIDNCRGNFWASRYKSIAVLGEEALLATCLYIDLNPFAAGVVKHPEQARFTSLYVRVEHCRQRGRMADLRAARQGAALAARLERGLESGIWLCPIQDRRNQGDTRVGLLEGFSLGSYLLLLDDTSRMFRPGKARVGPDVAPLLERLGIAEDQWRETLQQMFARSDLLGVAFSCHRELLRQAAQARGCRHLANLNGCPA